MKLKLKRPTITPVLVLVLIFLSIAVGGFVFKKAGFVAEKQPPSPSPQRASTDLPQASEVEGEGVMTHEEIHLGIDPGPSPGNTIVVSGVVIPTGGYVVVYRQGENELFGEIIGYSDYLGPEKQESVTIKTKEEFEGGDRLLLVLHADNGDQIFTSPEEDPHLIDPGKKIPLLKVVVRDS